MAGKSAVLDRYVGYSGNLCYADKIIKALGYSLSTLSAILRARNAGTETVATEGLQDLYRSIALARCLFRFIGVTDAVEALKNDSWAGNWPDVPQIRLLARLEAWTMVWYHAFEHLAWAASVAPKFVRFDASKWFAVSDWGWLAYCLIDAWMNRLKLAALRKREEKMRRMRLRSGADVGADEEELRLARRMVLLQQLRMLFYIPNAWHWAYTKGKIPGAAVAVLGLSEAVVGLIQSFPRK